MYLELLVLVWLELSPWRLVVLPAAIVCCASCIQATVIVTVEITEEGQAQSDDLEAE